MTVQENGGADPTMVETGQGHLVGVQPAQPRQASAWVAQERPDQAVTQQNYAQPPQQGTNVVQPRWTDEDLNEARRQEKDKLYGRMEEMNAQLHSLQQRQAEQDAERERLAAEAAEALRAKEEEELGIRDLLTRRETEWQQQLAQLEQRYDADRAVFDKERFFTELQTYRRDRLEQEAEFILPELRDLVTGESIEAIDASIATMKARTEQIFANMTASQPPPPAPRGAAPTAPPVGPMEQLPSYESLTPDDIRGMDMETYKRYRNQLLHATNPQRGRR